MAKKNRGSKDGRHLAFAKHHTELETPAEREAFAGDLADFAMDHIVRERKRRGLPPLKP